MTQSPIRQTSAQNSSQATKASEQQRMARALQAIEKLQAKISALEAKQTEAIAIVGMGCRFPGGANNPAQFWQLLSEGRDAISTVPSDRWDADKYYDSNPDAPGKIVTRNGGFVGHLQDFDAAFFNLSPREAASLDPQQRLLLEVSWEAMEHGGMVPSDWASRPVGVFVGMSSQDYSQYLSARDDADIDAYLATGNSHSAAAGRLSYTLGFTGPSLVVDTACSSSLVSLHLAAQSLRNQECDVALAGGVNRILAPEYSINFSKAHMLSLDGRCKTFDASADGFARAEGCGMVVLKRLSDAVASADNILALIRGSAVNQDGRSGGLTVPNGPAQQAVIRQALENARVSPEQISYVEAHGTGTSLGDPIEAGALGAVFANSHSREQPLNIGSVKTNIGHLEAAAGIAGVMKVVLAMQHNQLPAHLHFQQPSPHIKWDGLPLRVTQNSLDWTQSANTSDLFAGVSSFGFSGTNAHVVLGSAGSVAPARLFDCQDDVPQMLVLSAKGDRALLALAEQYQQKLSETDLVFRDLCWSAWSMRSHFSHRLALAADSTDDAVRQLSAFVSGEVSGAVATGTTKNRPPKVAFLFTGQGSQYEQMGNALYETEPIFRQTIDRCNQLISVPSVQTALFSLQYALTQLWQSWGVSPVAVLGHSIGEYAAACSAGVMDWEAALLLVERRSQLIDSLPAGGGMAAVMAAATQVTPYLQAGVTVAADNGPLNTVISGPQTSLNVVLEKLDAEGIQTKKLRVNNGFHSSLMEPILEDFNLAARGVTYRPAQIDFVSTVTGKSLAASPPEDWVAYWTQHIRQPVQFWQGMSALAARDIDIFVEVGPKPTLITLGQVCLQRSGRQTDVKANTESASTKWLASLRPSRNGLSDDRKTMFSCLAQLYVIGAKVNWPHSPGLRVDLPTYPFQRERYWIEVEKSSRKRQSTALETAAHLSIGHPLLGRRLSLAKEASTYFQTVITSEQMPFLQEHRVFGRAVLPAVGYVEIAIAAVLASDKDLSDKGAPAIDIRDITFHQALTLDSAKSRQSAATIQTVITPQGNQYRFEIFSLADSERWQRHASGMIYRADSAESLSAVPKWENFKQEALEVLPQVCYQQLEQRGIYYGESFRAIQRVFVYDRRAFSRLQLPDSLLPTLTAFELHPVLLDACLQSLVAIFSGETADMMTTYLPAAIESVQLHADSFKQAEILSYVEITAQEGLPNSGWLLANLELMSLAGERLVSIKGLRLQPATKARVLQAVDGLTGAADLLDWLYTVQWQTDERKSFNSIEAVEAAIANAEVSFAKGLRSQRIQNYLALLPQLEQFANDAIIQTFSDLHRLTSEDSRLPDEIDVQKLRYSEGVAPPSQWKIVPQHEALFSYLAQTVDWTEPANERASTSSLLERYQRLLAEHPEAEPELTLIQRCGTQLSAVLQGATDPLALLLPGGDAGDLFRLYHQSPGSQLMNQQVRQIALDLANNRPGPIRILEVGGGTGGTTADLLPALNQQLAGNGESRSDAFSYTFTDISPLFVSQARERFANDSALTCQTLDIEQPPNEQGFELGTYDVVVAANVLHATADVEQVLENVRSLLAPGGQLVLLEGTRPLLWLDLIFGMTEGWWKRDSHPLMSVAQWQRSIEASGFEKPRSVVPTGEDVQNLLLPQSVIVATASAESIGRTLIVSAPGATLAEPLSDRLAQQDVSTQLISLDAEGTQLDAIEGSLKAKPKQIVFLIADESSFSNGQDLQSIVQQTASILLKLLQRLATQHGELPQLLLATQGVSDGKALEQSPLWGLMRVAALEFPALRCCRLDLDPQSTVDEHVNHICQELQTIQDSSKKQQLCETVRYRAGNRQVARLSRLPQESTTEGLTIPSEPFKLSMSQKGSPDYLQLTSAERRSPAKGEIEVRVQAAGLNFIDVLDSLGLLPFERDWLGVECAGEVVAVGEGADQFAMGDAVVALAAGSLGQFVTLPAALAVMKPHNLSATVAATLPANFLTAYYALETVAQLKPGDRILIHAAAGGTGMAAVKVAQLLGAEVYATASPSKWPALRALGVKHVMNSRTLDFAEAVMAQTDGQGVDVVLNALSGEFVDKGLSVLAPGGCFVEIGKRDVRSSAQIAQIWTDIRYEVVDLMAIAQQQPETIQALLQTLKEQVEAGELTPHNHRTFPITQAPQAFRHMQRARHIGKIVFAVDEHICDFNDKKIRTGATYLITGGTGGLGLATAQWLTAQGAEYIALLSRGAATLDVSELQALEAQGVTVQLFSADVADRMQLANAIASIRDTMPPIHGVVHAAGVLSDGVLQQLDWTKMESVLAPKVWGAWNLHELTAADSLDFFWLYSSAASLLGSPGQGSHVAANSFLDMLARYRRQQGWPALSINWGPWAEVGSAASETLHQQMEEKGVGAIAPAQGQQILSRLMALTGQPFHPAQIGVVPIDWSTFSRQGAANDPFFTGLAKSHQPVSKTSQPQTDQQQARATENWTERLRALPHRRRTAFMVQALQTEVARVLGLSDTSRVDPTTNFFDLGMDSLMAVELKNRLDSHLEQPVASTVIFEHSTLQALAAHLVERSVTDSVTTNADPPAPNTQAEISPDIQQELAALESLLNRS